MPADIDAILLRIIAKAHGYDVGFALLADRCQSAKTLALEIGYFFWSKFAHRSLSFVHNSGRSSERLFLALIIFLRKCKRTCPDEQFLSLMHKENTIGRNVLLDVANEQPVSPHSGPEPFYGS